MYFFTIFGRGALRVMHYTKNSSHNTSQKLKVGVEPKLCKSIESIYNGRSIFSTSRLVVECTMLNDVGITCVGRKLGQGLCRMIHVTFRLKPCIVS